MKLLVFIGFIILNADSVYASDILSILGPNSGENPRNTTEKQLPIQCPNGFIRYEEYCYRVFPQRFSWLEAIMFCRMFDLELAKLHTEGQFDFLKFHLKSIAGSGSYSSYQGNNQNNGMYPASGFWLSATDAYSPGHWFWINDKSEADFAAWGGTKPSKTGGCLGLSKSSSFSEAVFQCGQAVLHPICEKRTSMLV